MIIDDLIRNNPSVQEYLERKVQERTRELEEEIKRLKEKYEPQENSDE